MRKAIDDFELNELEAAMLHACNSIDGTAKKVFPPNTENAVRFTQLVRDNYSVFGLMAMPGINLVETQFPVTVRGRAGYKWPDIADVIYGIHRCTHGHGDELPNGFDLLPDAGGGACVTRMMVSNGSVQLSDRVIFGLLAVAILCTANRDQRVPEGYYLSLGDTKLLINKWWGRASDFATVAAQHSVPQVAMDFGDWTPQD